MDLKSYQQVTLDILDEFLSAAKLLGVSRAFEKIRLSDKVLPSTKISDDKELFDKLRRAEGYDSIYRSLSNLADVPFVCLRLPTGGGKTLIGTHAIQVAAENFLACENPFVLWLVPTKEIRQQTLRVLRAPNSFYGELLRNTFSRVNIFDVSDFRNLRGDDLSGLNICVATFQSFKVTDREGRKVYQANEDMTPLFRNIPRQEYFHIDEGNRYESFANLISYLRPLMIVDEAHNYSTTLSFDITKQLCPATVIELTATPATNSNVLVKVSASELQAAQMIKFPVIVGEVSNSPEKTLDFAVQKLAALEKLAADEKPYLRPIALYQAENRNRPYNVEYIENYLRDVAKIFPEQIAVATGERHELDGVNLKSPDCPIRHVITVQALKEGWDCPFASVFCSLATTHSAKDAEQLLGRVLRMPYAKKRRAAELNKAYAFVRVASWEEAIAKIKDNLLGMGFDKHEVNNMVGDKQQVLPVEFVTQDKPNFNAVNLFMQSRAEVTPVDGGWRTILRNVTEGELRKLTNNRNIIFTKPEDSEKFLRAVHGDFKSTPKEKTPAERGVKFSIPQLYLDFGDGKSFVPEEADDFFPQDSWSLAETHDYELPISHASDDAHFYELNLRDERLTVQLLGNEPNLFDGVTTWTQTDLIDCLSRSFSNKLITEQDFKEFTRRALDKLEREKNFSLAELVRLRFTLNKLLKDKVSALISAAIKRGWQKNLFGDLSVARVDKNIAFTFDNEFYAAKSFYNGDKVFNKHFYPQVGFMNGEEILCAQFIDANRNVETWIRNMQNDSENFFWLQTSSYRFYPDFVVKLTDGTFAAVEYKGAHLADRDDTREKQLIGELWANKSNGLCKFIMAVKRDEHGRDLSIQLNEFFGG